MSKLVTIMVSVFLISCMSANKQDVETIYDRESLKTFVINTKSNTVHAKQLDSILNSASKDSAVLLQTILFLEEPFSNPNSQYKNDDLYAKLLQAKIKSPFIDSATASAARSRLYLLMQNKKGKHANDFVYTTPTGQKKKMYDVDADFTLLYFYNPDCNACKEMKAALMSSEILNWKIKTQNLKVIAVYTDKDEKVWRDHLNEMPGSWIQGRDEDQYLYINNVYDLRAIPTIYLLDKQKRVLLKDCTSVAEIEKVLLK